MIIFHQVDHSEDYSRHRKRRKGQAQVHPLVQHLSERKPVLTYSRRYLGGKMRAEGRLLEPAVLLILLKVLSNCFQWWRMGVSWTRIAWLWDIPKSRALEHSRSSAAQQSHAPRLMAISAPSWQSRQSVWASCSERAAAMSPPCCRQQLHTRRCGRFARCPQREQLPTCMSFIPSCAKVNKQVNKACKQENVLPSQPFLLHFSKQFFWFIGSFIFHSKLWLYVKGERFLHTFLNLP